MSSSHEELAIFEGFMRIKVWRTKCFCLCKETSARENRSMGTQLVQDVRYALRQLAKTPGFTLTAVLTLALGIGANSAIFTLINAILMKNLPVANPATLVRLGDKNDCCVGQGIDHEGDYSLFSTETYQ